ncbi:MAG: GAP family protein [Actinomycetota bacterium]|nr:GAP family protein [Actinomycetota bacterium]
MFSLLTLIASVGLADSIDPAMIVPALYFAPSPGGGRRVAGFASGVFTVNIIGGVAIALGPGRFLLKLMPHLGPSTTGVLELVAGAVLLAAAVVVWLRHPHHRPAKRKRFRHAAPLAGAAIALAELPTALPYFVIIVSVIRAHLGIASTVALLSAYQVLYLAPVLVISILSRHASQSDSARHGEHVRSLLLAYENRLLATVLFVLAAVLLALGSTAG